jgi:DNA-binding transcriptional ArsR family regulator
VAQHPVSIDQRLAKALSHSLRAEALQLIAEGVASPKSVAEKLDVDLPTLAYHVRVLRRLGCIELVETKKRRGAVEHIYRVAARALEKKARP